MSEEEIKKYIKVSNYNEHDVEKLLYELDNNTGDYSCFDIATAIIYYRNLYNKEKEKNKELMQEYHKRVQEKIDLRNEIENYISKDKIKEILEKYKYTEITEKDNVVKFYKEIEDLLEE